MTALTTQKNTIKPHGRKLAGLPYARVDVRIRPACVDHPQLNSVGHTRKQAYDEKVVTR